MHFTHFFATALCTLTLVGCHLGRGAPERQDNSGGDALVWNGSETSLPGVDVIPEVAVRSALYVGPVGCGGVMVGQTRVLTAKHCFTKRDRDNRPVVDKYGNPVTDYNIVPFGVFGRDVRPRMQADAVVAIPGSLRVHPQLDLATFDLERAPVSPYQTIPMWGDDLRLEENKKVYLVGYGPRAPNENSAYRLAMGVVTFLSFEQEISYNDGQKYRSVLRFSGATTQQGSLPGDSGSPVIVWQNGYWGLLGIVSGGNIKWGGTDTVIADSRPNKQWIFGR